MASAWCAQAQDQAAGIPSCPTTCCPTGCRVLAVVYLIFNEGYAAGELREASARARSPS